ncbi:MAG: hypothetical protein IJW63_03305 [Lachnospiraceae bacterium]|nr:hypothetical protein [Lachnospiraceae bacterium]
MKKEESKMTPKRIAAIVALVLLALLYIVTFFVALFAPVDKGNLFAACLMATIAVPLLAWIYIWLYGQMTGKKTMADLNLMQTGEDALDGQETGEEEAEEMPVTNAEDTVE